MLGNNNENDALSSRNTISNDIFYVYTNNAFRNFDNENALTSNINKKTTCVGTLIAPTTKYKKIRCEKINGVFSVNDTGEEKFYRVLNERTVNDRQII